MQCYCGVFYGSIVVHMCVKVLLTTGLISDWDIRTFPEIGRPIFCSNINQPLTFENG